MSVSEINFCIHCGNSVKVSKYCSKCGNEVASTVLATKENNVGLNENNQVKKTKLFNSHIEKTETYFFNNRIDFKETKEIGTVTHYNGKPFTGIGFRLYDNGEFKSEVPMINGLAHGISKFYNEKGEVIETVLFEKDKEIAGYQGEIDKLFKELKKKKITVKELESLYNNDKISLDELSEKRNEMKNLKASENIHITKKSPKDSSNNTKYKWGTFLGPYIFAIYTKLSIPPIEMAFDGFGGFTTFISLLLSSFIGASAVAIMLVCASLIIACLTFLIGKGKSFWNVAFTLSIVISGVFIYIRLKYML